jgi:hypothetical protein
MMLGWKQKPILTPKKVQGGLNRKPDRTLQTGKHVAESYKLRRTIPFLGFGSMHAIQENGILFEVSQGSQPTVQSIEKASGRERLSKRKSKIP